MKASVYNLALILSCIISLQCNTGKKMQDTTGNDLEKLIRKLQKDPADEKSIALLSAEYRKAQQQHLDKIEVLQKNQSLLTTEAILAEYSALQQLYTLLQTTPGVINKLKPIDYSDKLETSRNKLINELTDEADYYLKQANKVSCRKSYFNLIKLQTYQPNNSQIANKIRQSLQCASVNIAMEEPVIDTRFSHYNAEIGDFYKKLITVLRSDKAIPFITIESLNPQTDESIRLHFTQFDIGSVTKDNNSREVVNNQPYTSGGRRSTTGTIPSSATITTTRIAFLSVADLQLEILNNSGTVINKQEFNSRHEWNNEVNTYSGDRRALTSSDRAQLRNPVKNLPTDSEIVNELLKQLTEKVLDYLQSRYTSL